MYAIARPSFKFQLEPILHFGFWIFYFASIHVDWAENWFDRSLRPESVSQYAILLFPVLFYVNAFWLLPKYLKHRKWLSYLILTAFVVFFSEVFRCFVYVLTIASELNFADHFIAEYTSYDNVIFGRLNPAILALQFSFGYRFSIDWLRNNSSLKGVKEQRPALQPMQKEIEKPCFKESYFIKRNKEVLILKTIDIVYFKAQGDFVIAIAKDGRKNIVNSTLTKIQNEIDPSMFFRINRSELINKSFVLEFETYIKNRQRITLDTISENLYTSNSRTPEFRKWLKG